MSTAPSHTTITGLRRRRRSVEEILLELLADQDPALRQAALECLNELEEPPPGDWWLPGVEDSDPTVRSLAAVFAERSGSGGGAA